MEPKGFKDKLGLKKLDMKLIQTSHVNVMEQVLTIHYNVNTNDWEILSNEKIVPLSGEFKSLKVISYNVWFGSHNYSERLKELRRIFLELDPDFICLQEVTEKFQNIICSDLPFAQKYYVAGSSKLNQSGVMIFSKFPFSCKEMNFTSNMFRSLLIAEININGAPLFIATSHLESDPENKEIRLQQLKSIAESLKDSTNVIFAGDTNSFDASETKEFEQGYDDAWVALRPNDQGFTLVETEQRQDRVYVKKGAAAKPKSIELIGKDPLPLYQDKQPVEEGEIVTPSDHYGIYCELELK